MTRYAVVLSVLFSTAVTAQEFRWVWKDTVGKYVEWQGDQGGGNTVLIGPTGVADRCQVVGLSSGGSASWVGLVDSVTANVGCIGAGGNIYIGGRCRFPNDQAEVVALGPAGQPRWRWLLNSPYPYVDEITCVADNRQGMVYAGGDVALGGSPSDFAVFSIDAASGATIDTLTFPFPCDGLFKLACGTGGEVYGIGSVWNDTHELYLIYRWDGHYINPNWYVMMHGGGPGMNSRLHGMAVSDDGNVYVIGQTQYTMDHDEFNINQLNGATGTKNWAYTIVDSIHESVGIDVAAGPDNNVYALGQLENSSSGQDLVVVSLTPAGAVRWTWRFAPGGNRWAWAKAIKVGADNSVYIFGDCTGAAYNSDMLIVCLTTDGRLRWTYQYDGGSDDYIHPDCGFYSSDNKLYAAGTSRTGSVTWSAAISVNSVIGVGEDPGVPPPARPAGAMFARGVLRLAAAGTLYDAIGNRVADLSVGANDVRGCAPGAYFLRSGDGVARVTVVGR